MDNVPDPVIVDTVTVIFSLIVSVMFEPMFSVPEPEIVGLAPSTELIVVNVAEFILSVLY